MSRPVKGRRRQDQDGRIDEEGEHERRGRIDGGELDRLPLSFGVRSKLRVCTIEEWR